MDASAEDRRHAAQALSLAALGDENTSPNPRVGSVVVRDGEVVGCGYHRIAGGPHAEAIALDEAGERARGATLYVNLEPCAHHGRTPPCAQRIIDAGISRVVAAIRDPDPRVDGKGFRQLQDAGIEVSVGLLEREAEAINATFLHWHRVGRPWVTLKAALSLDGRLSAAAGESRWISGPASRACSHRMRLQHDAILVGAGTVRRDDPALTVRLPGVDAVRRRVVVSGTLDLPEKRRLFEGEGPAPIVYAANDVPDEDVAAFEQRVEVTRVAAEDGDVDLGAVLRHLGSIGVRSVLVEGGARTHRSFLDGGLVDRVVIFRAASLIGDDGATAFIDGPAVERPADAMRFEREQIIAIAEDLVWVGHPVAGD